MEIKAKVAPKGNAVRRVGGEPRVDVIKEAAVNLSGFLVEKQIIPADSNLTIEGVYGKNGQKSELSFGLFVNGKVRGVYRAIPANPKKKKPAKAKSWGTIKSDIKCFDLESGNPTNTTIKGVAE